MSKLRFLKKAIAISLAVMSFVPAVGATKSDLEFEPPTKIAKMEFEWDVEHEEKLVTMLFVAGTFYSQDNIKSYVESLSAENIFFGALQYMFRVFEGKEVFDEKNIRKNLEVIGEKIDSKGDLVKLFKSSIDHCSVNTSLGDREISVAGEVVGKLGILSKPGLIVDVVDLDNEDKHNSLEDYKGIFNCAGEYCRTLKDFQRISNPSGRGYELCFVGSSFDGKLIMAIKMKDGEWVSYTNKGMKKVSEGEIVESAKHINAGDVGTIFLYRAK